MTTLLIVLAHPHTDDFSWSLSTTEKFKEAYRQTNPSDKIIIRDLFAEKVPALVTKLLQLGSVINILPIYLMRLTKIYSIVMKNI
ncbi:NAD(P)H-dependent oxidoreductase [Lactococcus cremoris]|uniref:NAD(P)H-dependent oxidoreductase n=1 Tax=Lactococcus lactis subsp. cremoris TaxID=1359 RepID=UPI0007B1EDDB|nr:FMN-dependent NADH-azoreductase 1 [Lactococcus cremoris]MDU8931054.1 FMN-dependent NADH-azoreductase 2 [Lactococcus cremoris]